jgi:hypothetical protein
MQIMPRGVLSYLHADFLKFKCNNYDFVEYYFVVSKLHISCKRGNASRRWSHPKVQTDARTKTVSLASAARRKRTFRTSEMRRAARDALSKWKPSTSQQCIPTLDRSMRRRMPTNLTERQAAGRRRRIWMDWRMMLLLHWLLHLATARCSPTSIS